MQHYTYVFSDPSTGVPFYVGVGRKFSYRVRRHLDGATHAKDVHAEIRRIRTCGSEPRVIVVPMQTEAEALDLERLLIAEFGRRDRGTGSLFNRTSGGQGATGRVGFHHTPETRARIGASILGKKRRPETLAAMREAAKKRLETNEGKSTLAKMRAAPRTISSEGRKRMAAAGRANVARATAAASEAARRRRDVS